MDSLLGLEDLGEASLVDLAAYLKADATNVRGAFLGDGHRYKVRDSLACLGLVMRRRVRGLELWCLTPAGRCVAAEWRERRRRVAPVPRVGVV